MPVINKVFIEGMDNLVRFAVSQTSRFFLWLSNARVDPQTGDMFINDLNGNGNFDTGTEPL